MRKISSEVTGIQNDREYHDMSERLRIIDRAIIQLIMIKEDYEQKIKEYLKRRDQWP